MCGRARSLDVSRQEQPARDDEEEPSAMRQTGMSAPEGAAAPVTGRARARTAVATLVAFTLAATLGACGDGEAPSAADTEAAPSSASPTPSDVPTNDPTDDGTDMQISITIGDERFTAT